jgi:Holliday junction resolvasome RuvABC ATP-dependent DNA helicase subunit
MSIAKLADLVTTLNGVQTKYNLDETDLRIINHIACNEMDGGINKSTVASSIKSMSVATVYNRLNKKLIPKKFIRETKSKDDARGRLLSSGAKSQDLFTYLGKL